MCKDMENENWTEKFATEEQCRTHLYEFRFPNGHSCPRCQNEKSYKTKDGTYKCSQCGYKMSVRRGTAFENSGLKLSKWYKAIKLASSVPNPGKVTIKKYQIEVGIGHNRSAATVKRVIVDALKLKPLNKLKDNVEVCINSVVIANTSLLLVLAGEVHGRKVLRCRGKLYASYPTDLSSFIDECVMPGTKMNFQNGTGNIKTVEDMGYIWVHHDWDYMARTIEKKVYIFANAVRNCPDLTVAQKAVDDLCAKINCEYETTSFNELLKLVLELPPKSIERNKADE